MMEAQPGTFSPPSAISEIPSEARAWVTHPREPLAALRAVATQVTDRTHLLLGSQSVRGELSLMLTDQSRALWKGMQDSGQK